MPQILFAVESAESRSVPLSAQRLVNFFYERQPEGAKSQIPLFGAPGIIPTFAAGAGPIRGLWTAQGILYAISGSELYRVPQYGTPVLVGSGIAGSNVMSMADNGLEIVMVNGLQGYNLNLATQNFVQITSAGFNPASYVSFFDGYFVLNHAGTNQFFISGLYDGLAYNSLDFATAESQPDFCQGCIQNLELLFIICAEHIEYWYNAGTNDFPFQRYAGGSLKYGCVAPNTIISQDGAIFFLGSDKIFYRMQGNEPLRVSTHPIETVISRDNDLASASCFTYTTEGHKMVNLTLPSSKRTLVYDISTQRWHDRESMTSAGVSQGRWRANVSARAYGNTYIGDSLSGQIGLLDWGTYTEFGDPIQSVAYSAPIHQDRKRIFVPRFELDVQSGVGTVSGQGSDPQIMLRSSRDGGITFGDPQPWRSMGKIGEYLKRFRWLQRGYAYQWVFQISITDPVQRTIIGAYADVEAGM